eukprot:TRINITY_DN5477_c0_g1_i1.p1 TRINITY_DN5477_c0_g1~~TRINITY_DN5477_c0_g1_i1.p1  ORF type:complete len:914 (-),score=117.26 TRINITY_DN5477_c0_g1_i1:151-2892(-)
MLPQRQGAERLAGSSKRACSAPLLPHEDAPAHFDHDVIHLITRHVSEGGHSSPADSVHVRLSAITGTEKNKVPRCRVEVWVEDAMGDELAFCEALMVLGNPRARVLWFGRRGNQPACTSVRGLRCVTGVGLRRWAAVGGDASFCGASGGIGVYRKPRTIPQAIFGLLAAVIELFRVHTLDLIADDNGSGQLVKYYMELGLQDVHSGKNDVIRMQGEVYNCARICPALWLKSLLPEDFRPLRWFCSRTRLWVELEEPESHQAVKREISPMQEQTESPAKFARSSTTQVLAPVTPPTKVLLAGLDPSSSKRGRSTSKELRRESMKVPTASNGARSSSEGVGWFSHEVESPSDTIATLLEEVGSPSKEERNPLKQGSSLSESESRSLKEFAKPSRTVRSPTRDNRSWSRQVRATRSSSNWCGSPSMRLSTCLKESRNSCQGLSNASSWASWKSEKVLLAGLDISSSKRGRSTSKELRRESMKVPNASNGVRSSSGGVGWFSREVESPSNTTATSSEEVGSPSKEERNPSKRGSSLWESESRSLKEFEKPSITVRSPTRDNRSWSREVRATRSSSNWCGSPSMRLSTCLKEARNSCQSLSNASSRASWKSEKVSYKKAGKNSVVDFLVSSEFDWRRPSAKFDEFIKQTKASEESEPARPAQRAQGQAAPQPLPSQWARKSVQKASAGVSTETLGQWSWPVNRPVGASVQVRTVTCRGRCRVEAYMFSSDGTELAHSRGAIPPNRKFLRILWIGRSGARPVDASVRGKSEYPIASGDSTSENGGEVPHTANATAAVGLVGTLVAVALWLGVASAEIELIDEGSKKLSSYFQYFGFVESQVNGSVAEAPKEQGTSGEARLQAYCSTLFNRCCPAAWREQLAAHHVLPCPQSVEESSGCLPRRDGDHRWSKRDGDETRRR